MKNTNQFNIIPSKYRTWEEVFSNPQNVSIKTFNTGQIDCQTSGVLEGDHPKTAFVKMPVLAHVVTHESKGNLLIDTGFDSSFANNNGGSYSGILKKQLLSNYTQNKAELGIERQIKDTKIDAIFLTHMHEHAAGLPSLDDQIPIYLGKEEREVAVFPLVCSNFLKPKKEVYTFDFTNASDMPILGKCIDIYGDNSIWAISTPGHTLGHVSYLINSNETPTLITGDACITKLGYEQGKAPGLFSKYKKENKESFLKLSEFISSYPNLNVIYGHETDEIEISYYTKQKN